MNKKILLEILKKNGFNSSIKTVTPLKGGANNKVYKIIWENNQEPIILKMYFLHKNDKRNRLLAEFSFLSFLWQNKIRFIPQPLKKIEQNNIGLYSYIEAKPFQQENLSNLQIEKAFDFYLSINKNKENAKHILKASDSCFNYEDYILSIEKRLKKFSDTLINTGNIKILNFIETDLRFLWVKLKNKLQNFKNNFELPQADYRLSPSDFGFHNILINSNNEMYFIDFEYAGWDDPVKTICDFFTQPKINVPYKYLDIFTEKIAATLQHPTNFKTKIPLIFPLCQIKWCCIILNSYLSINMKRRNFANAKENKEKQIEKAISLLKKIQI